MGPHNKDCNIFGVYIELRSPYVRKFPTVVLSFLSHLRALTVQWLQVRADSEFRLPPLKGCAGAGARRMHHEPSHRPTTQALVSQ